MAKPPIHFEKSDDSYVSSCLFYATILDTAKITKISENNYTIKVKIKVNKAEEYGRADGGCSHYKGQEFSIDINLPSPKKLEKGENIKVHRLFKDYEHRDSMLIYELVK